MYSCLLPSDLVADVNAHSTAKERSRPLLQYVMLDLLVTNAAWMRLTLFFVLLSDIHCFLLVNQI